MTIDREEYVLHARLPRVRRLLASSLAIISEWRAACQKPYVAWSTGKDSTLCLWLALHVDPQVDAVYFDADCCLPESREMLDTLPEMWGFRLRVVRTRPLIEVLIEHGLFSPRVEAATLRATVHEPIKRLRAEGYDGVVVGVRADESRGRRIAVSQRGNLFNSKSSGMLTCWPLARWTARDVWAVTLANGLPYNKAYEKSMGQPLEERRVSYWGGETRRTYGRYVWLKKHHPELFDELRRRLPEVARFT